jgi:hypothetical protein
MSRYAAEGSGRYDHLHGDEDEIAGRTEHVSSCHECGSTDGCLCGVEDSDLASTCSMCGETPCGAPLSCRSQARQENEPTREEDNDDGIN